MFHRRGGFSKRRNFGPRPIVNSITNRPTISTTLDGTTQNFVIAKAVNTPLPTVTSDVSQGCIIQAVYCIINGCGTSGSGVLNNFDSYLFKNPGNNLVKPAPISLGSSNEKKFAFKAWHFMIMRNQDRNTPFHWEGWIPIPKKYQRFGTDDILVIVFACTTALAGHFSGYFIYKWKR